MQPFIRIRSDARSGELAVVRNPCAEAGGVKLSGEGPAAAAN